MRTERSGGEKFIGHVRLVDACGQPGCPVCRCVRDDSRHYLDGLIYEQVTDPDTRRALRSSWGFCNWHTWMLLEIGGSASGAAILYEDVIRLVIRRVLRLVDRPAGVAGKLAFWRWRIPTRRHLSALIGLYFRRPRCPACARATDAENRCLQTLLTFIADPELEAAYGGSDGVCVPHTLRTIEIGATAPELEVFLRRTLLKWQALRDTLDRFVVKHDHRNTEPFTDAEAAVYQRASELLAGARGLFGNHVHPTDTFGGSPATARPERDVS